MSTPAPEDADAALPPMALLATLQTATTVWEGVRERRAGRDPAAQEPAGEARAYLRLAVRELTRLHMQLLMAKVQATRISGNEEASSEPPQNDDESDVATELSASKNPSAGRLAATVRRFDMLMKLRRVDRLLHGAHQRLMSLYPAVSEELVEEARRCRNALSRLRSTPSSTPDEEDFGDQLSFFLQRLLSFAAWMQREL